LYLPDIPDAGNNRQVLTDLGGNQITWIAPESTVSIKDGAITLYATAQKKTDNENSMCVLFQPGNCDILITGDRGPSGEKALLAYTDLPDLEVLVVGHHGAKGVASFELLSKTRPEIALVSVSSDNIYGHPAQDVLERLDLFGCRTLCTSKEGTLTIRG
jgi:competence protein ComEC